MDSAIQFHSRVNEDGVLNLQIDLGRAEAEKDVVITIQPVGNQGDIDSASLSWTEFLERTYGSCASLDLERQDQGDYEEREPIE